MTEPTTKRTAEDVLRDLAMYLGVGGYNDIGDAPFDPEKFDRKIRWGIDYSVKATVARCADKVEELSKSPGTRWGEVKAAIQAFAPEPASSPAGVSEAGGEAAERSWRRTKFEFIGAMRQALINSGLTREQVIIADNAITEAFSDLAKPASSPAGGGEP